MVTSPTTMEEENDQGNSSVPHIPQYKVIKRKDAPKLLSPLYLRKVNDSSSQTPRGSINMPPATWQIGNPSTDSQSNVAQNLESNAGYVILNPESNTSSQNWESNTSGCSQNQETNTDQNQQTNTMVQTVSNAQTNKLSAHNFVNYDGNINGNKVIIVKNLQSAGINNIDSTSRGVYKGVTSANKACTIVGPFDTQATEAAVRSITQPNITQNPEPSPSSKPKLYPNAYPIILPPMKHNVPQNVSPKKGISATSTPYSGLSRKITAPVPPTTVANTDTAKSKNPGIAVVRNQVVNYNIHYSPAINAVDTPAVNSSDTSAKPTVAKKGLNDVVGAKRKILVLPKNMVTVDPRKKIILSPEPNHKVLGSPDGRFAFSPISEGSGTEQASEIRSKMESTEAANILVQLSNMDPSLAVKRTSGTSTNSLTNGSFAYAQSTIANSSDNVPSAAKAEFQDTAAQILTPNRNNSQQNCSNDDDVCVVPQQATEVEIYDDDDRKSVFSLDDYGLTETVSSADALKSLIGYKNYNILLSALCGIKDLSTKSRALAAFFSVNKEYRTSHCQTIEAEVNPTGLSQSTVQVAQTLPLEAAQKKNFNKASFQTQTSPQKPVKDGGTQCSPQKEFVTQGQKRVRNNQGQRSPQKHIKGTQGQPSPQKQVKGIPGQLSPQKAVKDCQVQPQKQIIKDVRSGDSSPQKKANITLNGSVTLKTVNRMKNSNSTPGKQLEQMKNINISPLKQQNSSDGAVPQTLQFSPHFKSSSLTSAAKINNEKDRQLLEKVSGLKGVTVSANRKPAVAHKPPQAASKSPRAQIKSSRAPNKPARGSVKSQQPGTKPSPVGSMIVNKSQLDVSKSQQIANISQSVVNKSQPIQNTSQLIVSKPQQINSQPIVSKPQQSASKPHPSKSISNKSQPFANNSQQTLNVSQPVASETPQAEPQPSQVAKKPSRASNKSPRVETKTAPVVSEARDDTEPIAPQIATRVDTPEKSMTPRLEDVIQHDKHGLMKIHSAVLNGTLFDIRHCAEELHSLGLSIDQKTTPDGYTALHMALIRRKNADVLYMLLSLGADPSANNHRDQPSLLLATKPRALKQGVPDAPPPPFLGLLAATQPHVVEQVCRQTDSQGLTAIMHCARHGWADELELLLEHTPRSVVTMAHHQTGQTPLDMAMACCADLPKGTCLDAAIRCVQLLRNALGIVVEEEVKEYPVQKVRPCNLSIKYAPAPENKLTPAKEKTEEANTDSVKAVVREEVPKNKEKKPDKRRKENKNKENGAEKIPKNKNSEEAEKKKSAIGKLDLNDTSMISSPQFSPVVPLEKPQGRKSSFKNSSRKRKLNLEGGSVVPKVSTPINMKASAKISSVLSNAVKVDVIKEVTHSDIVTEVESKDIKPKVDVKTKPVVKSPVKSNPSSKRRKVMQQKKDTALESHGTVKRMILDVGIEVPIDTVISGPDHQVLREVSPVKTKNRINILDKINTEQDDSIINKKTPTVTKSRRKSVGNKKDVEKANKSAVLVNQSGDVIGDCHVETQGPITGDLENANPLIVKDVLPLEALAPENNVDSIVAAFGNENAIKPKRGRRKQLKCKIKKVIQKKPPAKTISVAKVSGNKVGKKKITSIVMNAAEKVGLTKTVIPSPKESDVVAIPEVESPVKNILDIPPLKPLCSKSVIHVNLNNMRFSSTYAEIRNDKYIQPKVIISKIINRSVRDIFSNTPGEVPIVEVDEELIDYDTVTAENGRPFVDLTDDNSMSEFPKVPLELRQDSVLTDDEGLNLPSSEELPGKIDELAPLGDVDCDETPKTGSGLKRKYSALKSPNNSSFKMKFKLNLSKNEIKKIHSKNSRQSKKSKSSETPAKKTPVKRVSKTGTNETKEAKSELNVSKDGTTEALNTSESKLSKKKIKNPSVVKSATKKTKLNTSGKVKKSPGPATPKNKKLLAGSHVVSPLTALKKSVNSKIRRNSLGTIDQDLEMINKAVKDQTQPDRPPPVLSYLSLYHN